MEYDGPNCWDYKTTELVEQQSFSDGSVLFPTLLFGSFSLIHFQQILISSILRKIILRYAVFGGKLLIMMMMMMMMIIIIIIIIIIIASAVATVSHHTVTASARFSVFLGPQWPEWLRRSPNY